MVFPSQPDDFKKHISPTCSNICNSSFTDIHESHTASEVVAAKNQVLNPTCSNICNASFTDIYESHTASEVVASENHVLKYLENGYESMLNLKRAAYV
ncbi:uncharacterized protein LOC105850485 isoform X2 [Hydra vulgaris]|uniref:uncharacterized protein LOC105850485 isoform X2 n=1 Tax=Hydra vulgaris TaxID=6087 RepID=UPI0032E9E099